MTSLHINLALPMTSEIDPIFFRELAHGDIQDAAHEDCGLDYVDRYCHNGSEESSETASSAWIALQSNFGDKEHSPQYIPLQEKNRLLQIMAAFANYLLSLFLPFNMPLAIV